MTGMDSELVYYLWAVLLIVACAAAWISMLFTLPGSWVIVAVTALFAFLLPSENGHGIGWLTVAIIAALAAAGELIEFAAGAAKAAKQGASRRAMLLAIFGTIAGSLCGAFAGIPIPIAGPIIGAVGGGAAGAFVGAYAGETWKGKSSQESLEVGKAALIGRLLGTLGKLLFGAIMFVIVAIDALF